MGEKMFAVQGRNQQDRWLIAHNRDFWYWLPRQSTVDYKNYVPQICFSVLWVPNQSAIFPILGASLFCRICSQACKAATNKTDDWLQITKIFGIGSLGNRQLITKTMYHRFAFLYCGFPTRVRFFQSWAPAATPACLRNSKWYKSRPSSSRCRFLDSSMIHVLLH